MLMSTRPLICTAALLSCSVLLANNSHSTRNFPIVKCNVTPSAYERILMTQLRDANSNQATFRITANRLIELLVHKVVECLNTDTVNIDTPVAPCQGEVITDTIELVSVMRSGDVPLHIFSQHFPDAPINKILIQRNEETAQPIFKYKKISSTLAHASKVIVTEPMIATGGTLGMLIDLLKELGVKEENIIIASVCAAPEGLKQLSQQYPNISVVVTVIDEKLNEKKYISPGIGDFGDRYFGT
jgi:uracil phosphoribosyltransferase